MAQTSDPHTSFGEQGCPVVGSSPEESMRLALVACADGMIHYFRGEMDKRNNEIDMLKMELKIKDKEIESKDKEIESKDKEIERLNERIRQMEVALAQKKDCQQNESKNNNSKPSFRALITHRDPERVMKWLKQNIEGNRGKHVAAVLIKALNQKLINYLPTRGQFLDAAFTEKDIWRGVSKYLNAHIRNEMKAYAEAEIDPFPNGNDLYNSESSNLVPEN